MELNGGIGSQSRCFDPASYSWRKWQCPEKVPASRKAVCMVGWARAFGSTSSWSEWL